MYVSGQWAGGDVKLMLGLAMLFTAIDLSNPFSFANLFFNILIFGGLYGLVGTIIFGIIKFKELRKFLYFYDIGILIGGVAIILLILYLLPVPVNYLAASAIALLVLMRYIYVVAENLMFVNVSINKLTEGDWLAHDVVDDNGKTIVTKRNTGLVQEDIDKLRKSTVKSVLVKMGMPFVPGILIGTIITLFFGNPLLHLFLSNVFI
jgi:prepilin signal peptidase PulO-like enzyme (type II secretory pathway)